MTQSTNIRNTKYNLFNKQQICIEYLFPISQIYPVSFGPMNSIEIFSPKESYMAIRLLLLLLPFLRLLSLVGVGLILWNFGLVLEAFLLSIYDTKNCTGRILVVE